MKYETEAAPLDPTPPPASSTSLLPDVTLPGPGLPVARGVAASDIIHTVSNEIVVFHRGRERERRREGEREGDGYTVKCIRVNS